MTEILPAGKLPPELLATLLGSLPSDPSLVVGPGIGRDAAVVRCGDRLLVLKTDPITFATEDIGWYTAHINANDIACMGATPRWMLVTALLPEGSTTPGLVEQIFTGVRAGCDAVGATLVGGHTEITTGLERPILVGLMVGEAQPDELVDPRRAQPGDVVILARGIAIEGTALLARELRAELEGRVDPARLARAAGFIHDPGISVAAAARLLRTALGPRLHALHDPTEGGLATGLRELGAATGLGLAVNGDAIPVYPETRALCDALDVDPLGLIASGALLAVVAPEAEAAALAALRESGIPAAAIGRMVADPDHVTLTTGGAERPLPTFAVDEIARLFAARTNDPAAS
ncbi:MAG: AIR synthase related protein [Sphaerobacter sp.]|nr:AIR synthase related protein [Sphaerobacter sp.]